MFVGIALSLGNTRTLAKVRSQKREQQQMNNITKSNLIAAITNLVNGIVKHQDGISDDAYTMLHDKIEHLINAACGQATVVQLPANHNAVTQPSRPKRAAETM